MLVPQWRGFIQGEEGCLVCTSTLGTNVFLTMTPCPRPSATSDQKETLGSVAHSRVRVIRDGHCLENKHRLVQLHHFNSRAGRAASNFRIHHGCCLFSRRLQPDPPLFAMDDGAIRSPRSENHYRRDEVSIHSLFSDSCHTSEEYCVVVEIPARLLTPVFPSGTG